MFASSGGRWLHALALTVESFGVPFDVAVGAGVLDGVFIVGWGLADCVVDA
jgi:hypothetical protein